MTPPTQIKAARSRAFTMAELVVVLLIIAATAGIAGLLVSDTSRKAQQDAAKVSFLRIQAAIYGGEGRPGYYQDLGYPPQRLSDLLRPNGTDPAYNPTTRKGWNGPYLISNGEIPASGTELTDLQGEGYVAPSAGPAYYLAGDPAILDAYGRPYVLGYDPLDASPTQPTRVVSGGPDQDLNQTTDNLAQDLRLQ